MDYTRASAVRQSTFVTGWYLMKKNVSTENVALLTVWNMKFSSVTVRSVLFSVNRDRESQRLGIISESSACHGAPRERRLDYGGSGKPVSSVTSQYVNMDHDEGLPVESGTL